MLLKRFLFGTVRTILRRRMNAFSVLRISLTIARRFLYIGFSGSLKTKRKKRTQKSKWSKEEKKNGLLGLGMLWVVRCRVWESVAGRGFFECLRRSWDGCSSRGFWRINREKKKKELFSTIQMTIRLLFRSITWLFKVRTDWSRLRRRNSDSGSSSSSRRRGSRRWRSRRSRNGGSRWSWWAISALWEEWSICAGGGNSKRLLVGFEREGRRTPNCPWRFATDIKTRGRVLCKFSDLLITVIRKVVRFKTSLLLSSLQSRTSFWGVLQRLSVSAQQATSTAAIFPHLQRFVKQWYTEDDADDCYLDLRDSRRD